MILFSYGSFSYVQIFATTECYLGIVRYEVERCQVEVLMNFYEGENDKVIISLSL